MIMLKEDRRLGRSKNVCVVAAACLIAAALAAPVAGQECRRIMEQDSTINNLVDPPGYKTSPLGTLGDVARVGEGEQTMILIPGLGFSRHIFDEFMTGLVGQYRMYAVTVPGFGGTPAPPYPAEKVSFGEQTWTNGAIAGIEKLIREEGIQKPIIVGHWLGGTQIALGLAMRNPDMARAVILLAGVARMLPTDSSYAKHVSTPERRVASVDTYTAPLWFKSVTRETWDDNNFLPGDYAVNPVRGLRLWREAATPALHVWVRYLCEFIAQDVSADMERLTVPTLLLEPGLEGNFFDPGQNYMELFCHKGWEGAVETHPRMSVKIIPNSRACMWFDQPEAVYQAVVDFLKVN